MAIDEENYVAYWRKDQSPSAAPFSGQSEAGNSIYSETGSVRKSAQGLFSIL